MVDKNGKTLYIGKEVTFDRNTRPGYLIGRLGIVEGWGDTRVRVKLIPSFDDLAERTVRVLPNTLLLGRHKISEPDIFKDTLDTVRTYCSEILDEAIGNKIITKKQKEQILDLIKPG